MHSLWDEDAPFTSEKIAAATLWGCDTLTSDAQSYSKDLARQRSAIPPPPHTQAAPITTAGASRPRCLCLPCDRYLPSLRYTLHSVKLGYETEKTARLGAEGTATFEEEWVREYLGREEARRFADESPPDHEQEPPRQQQRRGRRGERQWQGEGQASAVPNTLSPTSLLWREVCCGGREGG